MKLAIPFSPVALREMRQLVRAKTILFGLVAAPIILFLASAFAVSQDSAGRSPFDLACGEGMGAAPFAIVSGITNFICMVVIPAFFAGKMIRETSGETTSLEFVTAISPVGYMRGKMIAATLLILVTISVSAPFTALAYVLRGVTPAEVLFTPVATLVAGLSATSVLMALSVLPVAKSLKMIGIALFAIFGQMIMLPVGYLVKEAGGPTHEYVLVAFAFALAAILVTTAFAASEIAPRFTDRERPLRRVEAIIFALAVVFIVLVGKRSVDSFFSVDGAGVVAVIGTVFALFIGMRAALDPERVSRSLRHLASRHPRTWRVRMLLSTGSAPGVIFAAISLVAVQVAASAIDDADIRSIIRNFAVLFAECVAAAVVLGAAMRAFGMKRKGMCVAFVGLVAGIILLNLFVAADSERHFHGAATIMTPFALSAMGEEFHSAAKGNMATQIVYAVLFSLAAIPLLIRDLVVGTREARGRERRC